MFKELRQDFEFLVVDLPPAANTSSTGYLLAGALDGVVLVIECERTRIEVASRAKENLIREKANILGTVFNRQRRRVPGWLYNRI